MFAIVGQSLKLTLLFEIGQVNLVLIPNGLSALFLLTQSRQGNN